MTDLQTQLKLLAARASPAIDEDDTQARRIRRLLLGVDMLFDELIVLAADEGCLEQVFPLYRTSKD